jgi:hypothetical protein
MVTVRAVVHGKPRLKPQFSCMRTVPLPVTGSSADLAGDRRNGRIVPVLVCPDQVRDGVIQVAMKRAEDPAADKAHSPIICIIWEADLLSRTQFWTGYLNKF